jgi:hypothetical protein
MNSRLSLVVGEPVDITNIASKITEAVKSRVTRVEPGHRPLRELEIVQDGAPRVLEHRAVQPGEVPEAYAAEVDQVRFNIRARVPWLVPARAGRT